MIDLERRGGIAILTMRHGKANAFDLELCDALTARFEEVRRSPVDAVVITGQANVFSAGVDLLRVLDGGAAYVRQFLPALSRAFMAVFDCPTPVVAAVNGHAIAGGCILACAADVRVMAAGNGRIGVPELVVGVPFPAAAFEIVRSIGVRRTGALVLEGRLLSPNEAEQDGLVDRLADADALLDAAIRDAESLAARPRDAFAMTKRQLRAPAMERIERGRSSIDPEVIDSWCADSTLARIRTYVERTLKK